MHRRVLILVENLPSPFDRRVWQEALALRDAGYAVSIICPTGRGYEKRYEVIEGVHIWRYALPTEGAGALGYAVEYSVALAKTFHLTLKVGLARGFDVVHACNPPDLFFLIGAFYKLFGKKFLFDHHDANPELYEAKFGRRGLFWKLMCWLERMTFRTADVSLATNESYRRIAVERGGMPPERVYVVRSGPSLERMRITAPDEKLKKGKKYLIGYVGVMGRQEGIDLLLHAARTLVFELGRKDVHFGLVGGGTSLEEMQRLAREHLGVGHAAGEGHVLGNTELARDPKKASNGGFLKGMLLGGLGGLLLGSLFAGLGPIGSILAFLVNAMLAAGVIIMIVKLFKHWKKRKQEQTVWRR